MGVDDAASTIYQAPPQGAVTTPFAAMDSALHVRRPGAARGEAMGTPREVAASASPTVSFVVRGTLTIMLVGGR